MWRRQAVIIALIFTLITWGLVFSSHYVEASLFGLNSQTIGLEANSPNPVLATGGGEITITGGALLPDSGVAGTMADIDDQPQSDQISLYVVREGDSLSEIASMFGVSVNTILWANDLKRGSAIKEGQMLLILPVSGVRHIVATGETVQGLAKKYKGDVAEIIQFNDLDASGALAKGDIVVIPGGEEETMVIRGKAPTTKVKGAGGPAYAGYYIRPITGGIRSQGLHGYNGVDLASALNTPIMASAAGQVIVSKSGAWNGGYGNYVVVKHDNGTQTLYAHNSRNLVAVGQAVVQGQVIAYMGNTGKVNGPTGIHVHFEIRGAKNPF